MDENPYEILGVAVDADEKTIRAAFRERAVEAHPDRNLDDANKSAEFRRLNAARELLLDAETRAQCDEQLRTAGRRQACSSSPRATVPQQSRQEPTRPRTGRPRSTSNAGQSYHDLAVWKEGAAARREPTPTNTSNGGLWALLGLVGLGVAAGVAASRFAPVDTTTGRNRDRKSGRFRKGYFL